MNRTKKKPKKQCRTSKPHTGSPGQNHAGPALSSEMLWLSVAPVECVCSVVHCALQASLLFATAGLLPLSCVRGILCYIVLCCEVCKMCTLCKKYCSKRLNKVLRIRILNLKTFLRVFSLGLSRYRDVYRNHIPVGAALVVRSSCSFVLLRCGNCFFNTMNLCWRKHFTRLSLCGTAC